MHKDLRRLYTSVPQYAEWEVVALFYAALHHIEAYLDMREGHHSNNHRERNILIREFADFRVIAGEYMYLYNLSIIARYELQPIPFEEVRRIETNEYAAIKRHVRSLLGI